MNTKALWHISKHHSEILDTTLASSNKDTCEIKALFSFVSLGTERLVANGAVPPELKKDMAVPFMEGTFDFPVKYGYSLVGKVTDGPAEWSGRMVHLLHPHQEICRVPTDALSLVPDGIPPQRATLASNLETALTAVWDAGVSIGDRVAVVGFGSIGALLCRLLYKIPGIELTVYENNPTRATFAKAFGFQLGPTMKGDWAFDISFNCSASEEGLQFCLDHTGKEGRVVELSWYGTKAVQINLGKHFHSRRLQLICSQVSNIPSKQTARWGFQRRKQTVLNLLRDPEFDRHLTNIVPFREAPAFFQKLRSGELDGLGYCLSY